MRKSTSQVVPRAQLRNDNRHAATASGAMEAGQAASAPDCGPGRAPAPLADPASSPAAPLSRRALLTGGACAAAAFALPEKVWAAPATPPSLPAAPAASASDLAFVHPELRAVAAVLSRSPAVPEALSGVDLPLPAGVRRLSAPGLPGEPPITVYLANEARGGPQRGVILYMHGGGFIRGHPLQGLDTHIAMARRLNCVLVSVDYRLAPATPYPGAVNDCYAVLLWLYRNAVLLGLRRDRIVLMGESAGGGLAAMLALAARDRGTVRPCFQALIYPMLDDRTGSKRPVPPNRGTFVWTAADNRNGWSALLGKKAGSASVPEGAVPARAKSLAGLPPAWIGVGALDLFYDEDVDYAQRLMAAGVTAELLVIPGAFHRFQRILPEAGISRQFTAALEAALARALA